PQVDAIVAYLDEHETIEGAPHLDPQHLAVFDCAFKPARGSRSIHYMGHIKMLGATQPFISGAISKTINVPTDATVEDIEQAYRDAWRLGTKAVVRNRAGYRGSIQIDYHDREELDRLLELLAPAATL
ncbi:MAG: vitamin B12-dependent ribonucleotide reductase, partial [Planctomycetota bacterium]|nr:vitamin B12-dependent ribonucleotide reductase [Planctomycetota bacterium]